jgi:predicted amidophosphoribosyltransferase
MSTSNKFKFKSKDIFREFLTMHYMIEIYCKGNHEYKGEICSDCKSLLDYSRERLMKCPHYRKKIACRDCRIKCHQEPYKSKIVKVMRYSGPRFIFYHPVLAINHLLK